MTHQRVGVPRESGTPVAVATNVTSLWVGGTRRGMRCSLRALVAVAALAGAHRVAASETSATLAVGVRVVRSCVIEARPVDASSSAVRLLCSRGHDANVLVGEGDQRRLAPPSGAIQVGTVRRDQRGGNEVHAVTLNF